MQPENWLERWQQGRIGFHRTTENPRLVQHHQRVLGETIRVLVPLCGKSVDLEWLVSRGHEVVGIELSELAVEAFFAERRFSPQRSQRAGFVEYRHASLTVLVGDFFAATPDLTGYCDGVYDRAAMIALPDGVRTRYAAHLQTLLAPKAKLLLVTLCFDAPGGPPFSVSPDEVKGAYPTARITELSSDGARDEVPGAIARGATFVREDAYSIEFSD